MEIWLENLPGKFLFDQCIMFPFLGQSRIWNIWVSCTHPHWCSMSPLLAKKQKSTSISYFALQAMLSVNIIIIMYETNEFLLLFYIVVLDNF